MSTLAYESLYIRRAARRHARHRLFCFGCAGSGASAFAAWPELFPGTIEVIAIQLPGREDRIDEPPATRLPPLVSAVSQAMLPYLDGAFALYGHSAGALLAFEVCRELQRRFAVAPTHLVAAAQPAPQLQARRPTTRHLDDDAFVTQVRALEGTADGILDNPQLLDLVLPALRADFCWCQDYVWAPGDPLGCRILALGGTEDRQVAVAELAAWREQTSSACDTQLFEGGHFFVNDAAVDVTAYLTEMILAAPTGRDHLEMAT